VQREELDGCARRTNMQEWIISDRVSILQRSMRINERKAGRFRTVLSFDERQNFAFRERYYESPCPEQSRYTMYWITLVAMRAGLISVQR